MNADLSRPVEQINNRNLRTLDFVASSGTQFQVQVVSFERNPKFEQVQVAIVLWHAFVRHPQLLFNKWMFWIVPGTVIHTLGFKSGQLTAPQNKFQDAT